VKSFGWALCALVLLVLVPTNASARLDGMPFTSWWEIAAVSSVLLLFAMSEVRKHTRVTWNQLPRVLRRNVMGGMCILIVAKCVVYVLSPTAGQFEVCYRSFNARSGVPCTETFEPIPALAARSQHFSQRSSESAVIDFGPRNADSEGVSGSNWRLPFINSLDFDRGFWPWEPADKAIETFPFWAEYRGVMDVRVGDDVRVVYLGEGRAEIGGNRFELEPSYERPTSVTISDVRSTSLVLDFAYLKMKMNSEVGTPPYAELRVERLHNGDASLITAELSPMVRLANMATDGVSLVLLLALLWLARGAMRQLFVALSLAGFCWLIHLSGIEVGVAALKLEAIVVYLVGAFVVLRRVEGGLATLVPASLVTSYGLTFRELELTRGITPQFDDVLVMLRGNDHLVYQGLTREMLSSGFLRGAEDIYYFQPGIRYVFYFLRLVFGESGFLTGVVSMSLLVLGIIFCFQSLPKLNSRTAVLACDIAGVSLLIWWSSSHTIQSTIAGLSEFATWILLFVIFGSLFRVNTRTALPVISLATAAVIWIRPNQGFGMTALLLLGAVLRGRSNVAFHKVLQATIIPFGALLLLIPLHNVAFGNSFVFLPTGHQNALQTSWFTIFRVFSDVSAKEFMLGQVRGLLYLPSVLSDIYSARLALSVLGFALVTALTCVMAFRSRGKPSLQLMLLTGAVIGQIVPFLRFSLYRYYPIHNVAIYLTLVLCCVTYIALREHNHQDSSRVSG